MINIDQDAGATAEEDSFQKRIEAAVAAAQATPAKAGFRWEKIALYGIPAGIVVLGFFRDTKGMVEHSWSVVTSLAALILAVAGVMVVVGFIQIYRESHIFDKHGVASEMAKVQNRIGTDKEQPGDSKAIAIKHAGVSILIALTLVAYTLMPE